MRGGILKRCDIMTKWELRNLRYKRRIVNQRLNQLDKLGLSNIPIINTARAAVGQSKIPVITKDMSESEIDNLKWIIDKLYYSRSTTRGGAVRFHSARKENFKKMLNETFGLGFFSEGDIDNLMQYIPYEDMKEFLVDYIYEHVIDVAHDLKSAGLSYNKEYMQGALEGSVEGVIVEILKEQNIWLDEDIAKGVIGDYAADIISGRFTIESAVQDYQNKLLERMQ